MPKKPNEGTPWAVHCPNHGKVYLDRDMYMYQLSRPDRLWECPICRENAAWDDHNYEKHMEAQAEAYHNAQETE